MTEEAIRKGQDLLSNLEDAKRRLRLIDEFNLVSISAQQPRRNGPWREEIRIEDFPEVQEAIKKALLPIYQARVTDLENQIKAL